MKLVPWLGYVLKNTQEGVGGSLHIHCPHMSRGKEPVRAGDWEGDWDREVGGWEGTDGRKGLRSKRPSVTSLAFCAANSACRCRSSSSSNCRSMMRLASSTRRSTSRSISSFLFSSSSSTRLATSSSTRRAVSSSISFSSISCCRLQRKTGGRKRKKDTCKTFSVRLVQSFHRLGRDCHHMHFYCTVSAGPTTAP